jgi:cardiolipin synthase
VDVAVLPEEELVVDEPDNAQTSTPVGEDHTRDVYTVANIITVLRLILVPLFFAVLVNGTNDTLSFLLFAIAASTDWIDGQIARRTGTVTEIGKAIDPLVDRLLIASGVVGLYIEGRLPLWIVLVLLARDLYLLAGAWVLARAEARRVEVIYLGKVTTMLLLVGFSLLLLNWPTVPGLDVVDTPALPGWGSEPALLGIWFVYAGVATSLATAGVYTLQAWGALKVARARQPA